jgi:alanyl-tRNA synthetase
VVVQKGSLVAHDRLRFDFSFGRGLTGEELQAITDDINAHIRQNLPVHTVLMTPEAAIKAGAAAKLGCDHTNYPAHTQIAEDALASLAGDLK